MNQHPLGAGSDEESVDDELHRIASRAIRVTLAIILVMVAAVSLLGGASLTTFGYALPARPGTDVIPIGTALWGPGVAAAVLAGLALVGSTGWLVWNIRTRPAMRWWVLAIVLVAAAFLVVLVVSQQPTPSH